jgi:hypothetical protein
VVDEGEVGFDESALAGGESGEGDGGAGGHGASFYTLWEIRTRRGGCHKRPVGEPNNSLTNWEIKALVLGPRKLL